MTLTTPYYQCPLCSRKMERNLILFLDHTHQHVIDRIKDAHPEWVASDGICKPCEDYYRGQLDGSSQESNIMPSGKRHRKIMGLILFAGSILGALWLKSAGVGPAGRLVLFFPLLGSMLGLIQAQRNTCALLAEQGKRETAKGPQALGDLKLADKLRRRGRRIFLESLLAAAALTLALILW